MSNIYLRATAEEKLNFSKHQFPKLKNSFSSQFWGAPTHADIIGF